MEMTDRKRVVIVGAGFAGLRAAKELKDAPVNILIVDRHNYHTFQPLLYQVATASLEPDEVAHAVRGIFHQQDNVNFRLATASGVDLDEKLLFTQEWDPIPYDYLILAAGASSNFFGIEGVQEHALPLKNLADAVNIRSHIMRQFECADAHPEAIEEGVLNFVVIGGGPTGVEMAGSLVELIDNVLKKDYPELRVSRARVIMVEMLDRLLAPFHEKSQKNAYQVLSNRGVEILLGESVVRATGDAVYLKSGKAIQTKTIIWAAGVRANPLADALGLEQNKAGRIIVNNDLSVPGRPEVFVVGDMAASKDHKGEVHPQLAQVALQGAKHAGKQIKRRLQGKPTAPFVYRDPGIMATIGRNAAVAELPLGLRFTGSLAWVMWLFLHLMYLVGFRNRLNVMLNWTYNYLTYDRSARLIFDVVPQESKGVEKPGEIEEGWSGTKELEHEVERPSG